MAGKDVPEVVLAKALHNGVVESHSRLKDVEHEEEGWSGEKRTRSLL